ncbi:MAG: hypothetical protein AABX10_03140 [Nanoarchaeota archaeon]
MGDAEKEKWVGCYIVERGEKILIVHAYEFAGEQWNQGFQIFLMGGENNVKLLYKSERVYYKRERALEAGKLFAENHTFRFDEENSDLVKKVIDKT